MDSNNHLVKAEIQNFDFQVKQRQWTGILPIYLLGYDSGNDLQHPSIPDNINR